MQIINTLNNSFVQNMIETSSENFMKIDALLGCAHGPRSRNMAVAGKYTHRPYMRNVKIGVEYFLMAQIKGID